MSKKIVVLGAGLAGLSFAYHYPDKDNVTVLEKSGKVGGTAGSVKVNNFVFDWAGHLLHLHNDYTKKLIPKLLKGNLVERKRKASIYADGVMTDYPFQMYTKGRPIDLIKECLVGLALAPGRSGNYKTAFDRYALDNFGPGICRHFMFPYNEKLYGIKVDDLMSDWCGQFVPKIDLYKAVLGAFTDYQEPVGYNASFYYPKKGGIQVLADAFAKKVRNINLEESVWYVNPKDGEVGAHQSTGKGEPGSLESYRTVLYKCDRIINTLPLPELLAFLGGVSKDIRDAASKLRYRSVLCLNLGINRSNISDKSWIYFPGKESFYRIGFYQNFSNAAAPKGCSSMFVEVSYDYERGLRDLRNGQVIEDLVNAGILKSSDKILAQDTRPIKYAYVIYDKHRKEAVDTILKWLERQNIYCIGRYAKWQYSFMEAAILEGKELAGRIDAL